MELVEFSKYEQVGDISKYKLVVQQAGFQLQKLIHTAGSKEAISRALVCKLAFRLTEAERDFAYAKHGDKWREHCPWKTGASPDVRRIGEQIVNDNPELFNGTV